MECGPLARDAAGPTPKGHKRERPCTGDHAPKNLATLAPCRTARPISISHAASLLPDPSAWDARVGGDRAIRETPTFARSDLRGTGTIRRGLEHRGDHATFCDKMCWVANSIGIAAPD